jgi:hypothetical protein
MEGWYATPQQTAADVPRDFSPLIATLDQLGVTRVYTDYWIAYRLDFATRERIVAVENPFRAIAFRDGQAVPSRFPDVRFADYERAVEKAPHGFIFFRKTAGSSHIVPQLVQHGYRGHVVGPFVVYSLPAGSLRQ